MWINCWILRFKTLLYYDLCWATGVYGFTHHECGIYTDIDDTPRVCRVRDTPSTSYAVCVFWVLVDIVMRMNIKNKKSNEGLASRCGFRFGEGITRGHCSVFFLILQLVHISSVRHYYNRFNYALLKFAHYLAGGTSNPQFDTQIYYLCTVLFTLTKFLEYYCTGYVYERLYCVQDLFS